MLLAVGLPPPRFIDSQQQSLENEKASLKADAQRLVKQEQLKVAALREQLNEVRVTGIDLGSDSGIRCCK